MTSTRRTTLLVTSVAAVAFVAVAVLAVPWDAGRDVVPVAPDRLFTEAEIARAEAYSGPARLLGWASLAVSLAVALVLGLTSAGSRLVRRLPGGWPGQVLLGTALVILVGRLATLPLSLINRARRLDYGLTEQGLAGWAADYAKSLGVEVLVTALALLVLVACARRWQRAWPAVVGGLAAVLVLAGSFLYPVLIEPVFNEFEPLAEGPFRTSVLELAEEEGVAVDDVLVADASRRTTTLNAYVSGFGDTRRVVVYDTLLDGLTPEQARVVVAHELAHAKHGDVVLGTTLGALGGVLGVGILGLALGSHRLRRRAATDGAADPAVVPLVLALVAVGMLLASPVESSISRAIESRADRTSLEVTEAGTEFVEMQHALGVRSLSDPTPPRWSQFWFGTHPTSVQRVGMLDLLGIPWTFDPAAATDPGREK